MGLRHAAPLSAALLLAACASAPRIVEEPAPTGDSRIEALQASVAAAMAADPASAPRGLAVAIPKVEETGTQLIFEARFDLPETFSKAAQDFTVYVSCERDDIAACTRKTMDAARALTRLKAGGS